MDKHEAGYPLGDNSWLYGPELLAVPPLKKLPRPQEIRQRGHLMFLQLLSAIE